MTSNAAILIEGYASVFGHPDLEGDVVQAGAFARTLQQQNVRPMLLQHRSGKPAGRWSRMHEDGYGLFVRGLVDAPEAIAALERGLDGLSIGFHARDWRARPNGGRLLSAVDLVEVSLVAEPCQRRARLHRLTQTFRQAA